MYNAKFIIIIVLTREGVNLPTEAVEDLAEPNARVSCWEGMNYSIE